MFCPNLNDVKTSNAFSHLVETFNKKTAYNLWNLNKGNPIHESPFNEKTYKDNELHKSILFKKLNKKYSYIESTIIKAHMLSDDFRNEYGDWLNRESTDINKEYEPEVYTDKNGEMYFLGNHRNKIYIDEDYTSTEKFLKTIINNEGEKYSNTPVGNAKVYQANSKSLNRKNAEIFTRNINRLFPNVKIKIVDSTSIKERTGFVSDGFVDDNGIIHINADKFFAKTGIHELGHVLEPLLQNNKTYQGIMKFIVNDMNKEGTSINSLSEVIKSKYKRNDVFLSNNKLKSELFAELLASNVPDNLMSLYASANMKYKKRDIGLIRLAKRIYKVVSSLFNNNPSTIEQLFTKLHYDITREGSMNFSSDDVLHLQRYFKNTGYHYRMDYDANKKSTERINGTSSLHNNLIGMKYKQKTEEDVTASIFTSMKNSAIGKDEYRFYFNGEEFIYPKESYTEEDLKISIQKDISSKIIALKENQKNVIVKNANDGSMNSDITSIFSNIAGKNTSALSVRKFLRYTGLNSGYKGVYTMSDLKNSNNENLRKLYNEELSELDPIFIVHNIEEDGTVDISLIDLTYDRINPRKMTLDDNNIFSTYMSTNDYINKSGKLRLKNNVRLRNTDVDIRNLQLGLLLLHIDNVLGNKIKLRNIGTLEIKSNDTRAKMVLDVEGLVNNLTILSDIPAFMESVDNVYIKNLIRDSYKYKKPNQSYVSQLMAYAYSVRNGIIEDEFMDYYNARKLYSLFGGDMDVLEQKRFLDSIKIFIENNADMNPESSVLYNLVAGASREIRTQEIGSPDEVESISSVQAVLSSAHNNPNALVQDVVEAVQKGEFKIVTKISNDIKHFRGNKKNQGLLLKVYKRRVKNNPKLFAASFLVNRGSLTFQHLYKTAEIKQEGESVTKKILLPKLHHTLSDSDTKNLYDQGVITDDDLAFTNDIIDRQRELLIQRELHNQKMKDKGKTLFGKTEASREKAEAIVDATFARGDIVMIDKSSSEMLMSAKFKTAINKELSDASMVDTMFEDIADWNENTHNIVSDLFGTQTTFESRLERVGLKIGDDGDIVLENESLNFNASTDLWKTYMYLNQSVTRKIEYEENILPVAKDTIILLKQLERKGKDQSGNIKFIKNYIDSNAYRRNQDDDKSITMMGVDLNASKSSRLLIKTYNAAVLPFKLSIGVYSMIFNANRIITESLSSALSNTESNVPKLKHFVSAAKFLFNPKNIKLVRRMSLDLHLWNRDERDLINNPFLNPNQKRIYDEQWTNIFNWATDTFTRSLAMIAVLKKNNSLDAYSYDQDTGDVIYDETKDRYFYDDNGNLKQEMKGEYLRTKKSLEEEGFSGDKLIRGIDMMEATNIKYISDKYLIGAFSSSSRAQINNKWLGALAINFRIFSIDRLNNLGIFNQNMKTKLGQHYTSTVMPDGSVVSSRDKVEIETMINSVSAAMHTLFKEGNATPSQFKTWYEEQSPSRKYNLAKSFIQVMTFLMIGAAYAGFDDDKKKSASDRRMAKFIGDMMVINTLADFTKSPFPAINALYRFGSGEDLTTFIPLSGAVKEINKTMSSN